MEDFHREYAVCEAGKRPDGWRLATIDEVHKDIHLVKDALSGPEKEWYICRLADGKINGRQRHYKIEGGEVRPMPGPM